MPKKEKKKSDQKAESGNTRRISRREFAIGSMTLLGSSPLAFADKDTDSPPFKLVISEDVRQIMEARHIIDTDLIAVIEYAEKTGQKLYREDNDHILAKQKLNTVYYYAEYSPVEGGFEIHTTYSHRFTLEGSM
jgi:hypothetical protein